MTATGSTRNSGPHALETTPTGMVGLDHVLGGGLPMTRSTLVAGTAGSGKTVMALQFLVEGIRKHDQPGVFVTFEESPEDLRRNALTLGFDLAAWEEEGKFAFVDASYDADVSEQVIGDFDFDALVARVDRAISRIGATRVSLDSVGAVFGRFQDAQIVRRELRRVSNALRRLGVTALMTVERQSDYGAIGRFGVEEFVCDNVMVMRNVLDEETRRRTVEVLKMRGVSHLSGEFPFTILPGEGIVVITLAGTDLDAGSTNERITSGLSELDAMCSQGMFRDSVTLVSGATGTGKTLLTTEFIDGGARNGDRSLFISFEESRAQLSRNAAGWGRDFGDLERQGALRVECVYPEVKSLEDHLVWIKDLVDEYQPDRLAIDSLSALERIAPQRSFREFLIGLTSFIKHRQIAGMLTATARNLLGGESTTEAHISTLTDMIVLLRYVEIQGEIRRGLTVLKLRGSMHDKKIHEFSIDGSGMHIGAPFRDVTGILAGSPRQTSGLDSISELDGMFAPED